MKVLYHLASLTTAATLMLQLGTFVEASPFFTEKAATLHGNDAASTQQCQGKKKKKNEKKIMSYQHTKFTIIFSLLI
jgi:hypothetical protein